MLPMFIWQSVKKERATNERKEEELKTCVICTIIFFCTLYLNIIFLLVYLTVLWINQDWENKNNWMCPPIGETGALAILSNHRFACNLTVWSVNQIVSVPADRKRRQIVYFESNNFNIFCLRAELENFLFSWRITWWPVKRNILWSASFYEKLQQDPWIQRDYIFILCSSCCSMSPKKPSFVATGGLSTGDVFLSPSYVQFIPDSNRSQNVSAWTGFSLVESVA